MMKKVLLLVMLMISGLGIAQTGERILVDGQISVPPGDDPEGITIINTTTNRGTVSDAEGEFQLVVGIGDIIIFSALQFQDFTVIIDQNVIEARQLNVFITQATTELPEVVVSPIDLSGNVEVDVKRIPDVEANLPYISLEEIYNASLTMAPGPLTTPENAAMRDSFIENGLNFANIFREIFSTREIGGEEFEAMDEELRDLYDDEFFREFLDIERTEITQFIHYAQDHGLSEEMFEEGRELELVEFLVNQSRQYKAEMD